MLRKTPACNFPDRAIPIRQAVKRACNAASTRHPPPQPRASTWRYGPNHADQTGLSGDHPCPRQSQQCQSSRATAGSCGRRCQRRRRGAMGASHGSSASRGPFVDGQHRQSCACRCGGRRLRHGCRTCCVACEFQLSRPKRRYNTYQSICWGGSSFAWEVLTVSTQPVDMPRQSSMLTISPNYGIQVGNPAIWQQNGLECMGYRLTWNWELALTLQESSVGIDELAGLMNWGVSKSLRNRGLDRRREQGRKSCCLAMRRAIVRTSTSRTETPGIFAVFCVVSDGCRLFLEVNRSVRETAAREKARKLLPLCWMCGTAKP